MAKKQDSSKQSLGFVEIAGFGGVEDGHAKAELSASVNQGVKAPAWTHVDKAFHKRVTFSEEELGAARESGQLSAYKKDVDAVQTDAGSSDAPSNMSSPVASSGFPQTGSPGTCSGEPSPLAVLKNFVDQIDNRLTLTQLVGAVAIGLVAVAVAAIAGSLYL